MVWVGRFMAARGALGAAALCGMMSCAAAADRGSAATLSLRALAASCAACHGTDGDAVRGSAMPPLAGLSQGYFLQQMRAFRDGTRTAPLMQQIARGFDEAQTQALAAYFERQRPDP
jgi:cytochrome c553